jgi:hypothetical protein
MPRNRALDLLKWLAMLCMVLDHLRYVGWSLDVLYIPGRLAFPWFCLAIAANLTRRPDAPLGGRYLGWLSRKYPTACSSTRPRPSTYCRPWPWA